MSRGADVPRLFTCRHSPEDMAAVSACFDRFPESIPVGVRMSQDRKSTSFEVHPQVKRLLLAAKKSRKNYEAVRDAMIEATPLPAKLATMPTLCEKQKLGELRVTQRLGHDSTQGKVFLLTHEKKGVPCALKASPLAPPGVYELFAAVAESLSSRDGSTLAPEKCYYAALKSVHAPREVLYLFRKEGDARASKGSVEKALAWLETEVRRCWYDLETEPTIEALNAFVASKLVSDGYSFFHPRMVGCFRAFESAPKKSDAGSVAKVSRHTTTGKVIAIREAFASSGISKIDEAIRSAYVPMQYVAMEKLDGFLMGLPESFYGRGADFRWDRFASVLAMIVAGLALGQKHIGFVSNDAHWNNIGYFKCPQDAVLRVLLPPDDEGISHALEIPTHGLLPCIIDGGRCAINIYGNTISIASGFMELYGLREVTINNKHADLVRTAWECTKLLRDRDAFKWTHSSMTPLGGGSSSREAYYYMRTYMLEWEHMNNIKGNPHAEACVALIQSWRTVRVPDDYETRCFAKVDEMTKSTGGRFTTLDHEIDRRAVRRAVMGRDRVSEGAKSSKAVLPLSHWLNKNKGERPSVSYPMDLEDYKRCIKDEYTLIFARSSEFTTIASDDNKIKKKNDDLEYQANSDAFIFSTVDYRAKVFEFDADPASSLQKLVPLFGVAPSADRKGKKDDKVAVFSYEL